jgi:hypothetical protein
MSLAVGQAHGDAPVDSVNPTKPKVYALVAAVGERFSFVYEVRHVDSRLEPYRRSSVNVPGFLDRIVLQDLDKAIAQFDPDSKRIHMTLATPQLDGVAPSERGSVAISTIVGELRKMPQRLEWDRIVVVTPAYKLFELDGLATKLQGFGVFTQPLKSTSFGFGRDDIGFAQQGREDAVSPGNKAIKSETYVAPYSYIEVWVLDPQNLAVLDRQRRFESQKLADPMSGSLDINQSISKEFLAGRIVSLIEVSVREAVMRTEINPRRGEVQVGEPRVVDPADARK